MCDQIVREATTERNLMRRTGASAQLGDLVGDMHTATWIVCSNEMPDNDDLVVWTKRGSRQGCPLGSIAFQPDVRTGVAQNTNSWRESMESGKRSCTTRHSHPGTCPSEAKARIDEHTLHDTRNWITTTLADVTFVDDACFSFEADNPVSLENSATTLLSNCGRNM